MSAADQTHYVASWPEAEALVRHIAADAGIKLVLWGVGNFVDKPHIEAVSLDAWSGGTRGYTVWVKPRGDGYMNNAQMHTIYVEGA